MPLYYGRDEQGLLWVASEMKAIEPRCAQVRAFPPGHLLDSRHGEIRRWYQPAWREFEQATDSPDASGLRQALEDAVHRQMMCDVPYGVLLSGGLDSSLIAAIAQRFADRRVESDDQEAAWWPRLHSFAIGLEDSPDLAAARIAAEGHRHPAPRVSLHHSGRARRARGRHRPHRDLRCHHGARLDPHVPARPTNQGHGHQDGAVGRRRRRNLRRLPVFPQGSDARAFHEETVRKLDKLHLYDCLRANKSMAAWGVEARVPFLDLEFLDVAMSMDPAGQDGWARSPGERPFCARPGTGLLPDEILWRQKEQFSDGVGYGWIDALKAHADSQVSDRELLEAEQRFPFNPPITKEQYLYRRIFERHFPSPGGSSNRPVRPVDRLLHARSPGLGRGLQPACRPVGASHSRRPPAQLLSRGVAVQPRLPNNSRTRGIESVRRSDKARSAS
jgi:asparagine synthase (glutamine-hydrolysing)